MEGPQNTSFEQTKILKKYYKPDYSQLFNKLKNIKTPVKNEILISLLDGNWHSELDLIRVAKQKMKFMGAVTLGTMIHSLNHHLKYISNFQGIIVILQAYYSFIKILFW